MVLNIPSFLESADLSRLQAALGDAAAPWVDGRVTAGHQGADVKRNQQIDEASPLAAELRELIISRLERNALFISAVLPHRIYPPMFNRYDAGMEFGTHVDGAVRRIPGSAHTLRTDLSATLFLAPPDAYDGGELAIESDFGGQQVKLAAGDLFIYTAASRHRVERITRGQRIAAVFWIQSLIRDDGRREQLFELDRTIQQLTRDGARPECLVRLSGHYHALLRLWTEL